MIKEEEVYKIGRLGKAHGVKGEVSFQFDDDIFDRVETEYLVLDMDGILVPFFLEEYRFRNGYLAIIKLKGVDTQQRAAELTGKDVYFPRALAEEEDEAPVLELLIGFDIVDVSSGKNIGTIADVNKQTANVLFELGDGTLIPASAELIDHIDTQQEEVFMNLPEGLMEL